MFAKLFLLFGSLGAGLGVGLGAFGAHAFKAFLVAENRLDTFETAVKYQFYHSLGLILIGILCLLRPQEWFRYAGYSIGLGMCIFSLSLYLLCASGIRWLGAVTPIGGVLMILGWLFLSIGIVKMEI
jgi:uncharacterized membrane protein YgdD (TMEM256/DUF423 family)